MRREFTGRRMLMAMLAFFGVIIAVNLAMATLAVRSWTGLLVGNAYVESQAFNQRIAATAARDARGLKIDIELRGRVPVFLMTDHAGAPVVAMDVTARVSRPTHEHDDEQFEMTLRDGAYVGAGLKGAGVWVLEIDVRFADGTRALWPFRATVSE